MNIHDNLSIEDLKLCFDQLKVGKEQLLILLEESELPEGVYNSNAIENSTLTLKETEKILLEMEVSRNVSLREVFEAKNLARVSDYIRSNALKIEVDTNLILLLHKMLIGNINDEFAGRFRQVGEYVRVGSHIAPAPEVVPQKVNQALLHYYSDLRSFFLTKIAQFHLEFEHIHPFCDGNGRMGRILINYHLHQIGLPPVIIRNKEKQAYYTAIREYDRNRSTKSMERILHLIVKESLHKRITYLEGKNIVRLTEYAKKEGKPSNTLLNMAKRQTIPAFREKGVWMIGV